MGQESMKKSKSQLITPRRPSGFGELLPSEQISYDNFVKIIRETFELFGFTSIKTPAIELAEVLLAKGGGETDKQIYMLEKGKNTLALRFDLTVPLARYVSEHYSSLTFPFRRYQIQEVWRAERAQRGRFREFTQCDVDVIGSAGMMVDAEIITVAATVYERLNVGDFLIRINNRKILNGFFLEKKLSDLSVMILRIVDGLEKNGEEKTQKDLLDAGLTQVDIGLLFDLITINGPAENAISKLRSLGVSEDLFVEGVDEIEEVCQYLVLFGVLSNQFCIDCSIARGLDYYTGTVYETTLVKMPQVGSIGSGGRYDSLAQNYTKQVLPGVGFSIGITRLFSVLKEAGIILPQTKTVPTEVMIVCLGEERQGLGIELVQSMRQKNISAEIYPEAVKITKSLTYANKNGIPYVIIIGEDEEKNRKLTLKDMSNGKQELISREDAITIISSKRRD